MHWKHGSNEPMLMFKSFSRAQINAKMSSSRSKNALPDSKIVLIYYFFYQWRCKGRRLKIQMLPTPALFRICQFPRKTYIGTHAQRQTQIELNRVSRLLNNMWKFCLPYMYLQRRTSVVGRVSRQIQNSAKCKIIWDVNSATCIKQCVTPIYQWWFYIWIKPIKLVFTSCVL